MDQAPLEKGEPDAYLFVVSLDDTPVDLALVETSLGPRRAGSLAKGLYPEAQRPFVRVQKLTRGTRDDLLAEARRAPPHLGFMQYPTRAA